jgi:hypothetical protein
LRFPSDKISTNLIVFNPDEVKQQQAKVIVSKKKTNEIKGQDAAAEAKKKGILNMSDE